MTLVVEFDELRGAAMPFFRGVGGFFASKDRYDLALGDLIVAVFTPRNSRPMNRSFGSTVHEYLFEPATGGLAGILNYVIRAAATKYVPFVNIYAVDVKIQGDDVAIGIVFGLAGEVEQVKKHLVLKRLPMSKILSRK